MIRFLLKGLLRDKNRCLLPVLVVAIGVGLTVFLSGYVRGIMGDMVDITAKFDTGHVKVTTRAYAENAAQMPNDLALLETEATLARLHREFPHFSWTPRIRFAGLIDVPDRHGETVRQGPATGLALDLLSPGTREPHRLNLAGSLASGTLPAAPGQILMGSELGDKLGIAPGAVVTYFGSTMNGSMAFYNFTVSGFIRFGSQALDRGAVIVDIADAREMLDMADASGEILGFLKNDIFYPDQAQAAAAAFNETHNEADKGTDADPYAPLMRSLKAQGNFGYYLDMVDYYVLIFISVFVGAMSVVLWNTGLIGGLRRYREFGIRLALGESKAEIFRSLTAEALIIGLMGSVIGTAVGVAAAWAVQVIGIDIGGITANATMMMPSVIRAKVTPDLLYIGFIPGLLAMLLGNCLAGMGIFKRETAQLFKELEV